MRNRRHIQINVVAKSSKNTDREFWLGKTQEERIEAVEFLRSQHYALSGYKSIPRIIPEIHIRALKE
jgi:hypothetical protein